MSSLSAADCFHSGVWADVFHVEKEPPRALRQTRGRLLELCVTPCFQSPCFRSDFTLHVWTLHFSWFMFSPWGPGHVLNNAAKTTCQGVEREAARASGPDSDSCTNTETENLLDARQKPAAQDRRLTQLDFSPTSGCTSHPPTASSPALQIHLQLHSFQCH